MAGRSGGPSLCCLLLLLLLCEGLPLLGVLERATAAAAGTTQHNTTEPRALSKVSRLIAVINSAHSGSRLLAALLANRLNCAAPSAAGQLALVALPRLGGAVLNEDKNK